MNPDQYISGHLKQVVFSAELLFGLFTDGYRVHYTVTDGVPLNTKLVTVYTDEVYVGFNRIGIVFEHPDYEYYEGKVSRVPELMPDCELITDA